MKIDIISDLHGEYPKLYGGDLLIVCGDLTARDRPEQYFEFEEWINDQEYTKKIVIAGNHDNFLIKYGHHLFIDGIYLQDSGTEFEGLKIWGSPWSLWFDGINPHCKAFTGSESDLKKKYDLIPDDIDILVTHTPPELILDRNSRGHHCGSKRLLDTIPRFNKLKLVCFGHIHENGSQIETIRGTVFVNASLMNQDYDCVNEPVRIEL